MKKLIRYFFKPRRYLRDAKVIVTEVYDCCGEVYNLEKEEQKNGNRNR